MDKVNVISSTDEAETLTNLVEKGAVTPAAAYIYAAQKQDMLGSMLHFFALSWMEVHPAPGYKDKDLHKAKQCHVCAKTEKSPDGTIIKLLSCSRCMKIFYCSRECQKVDWKRHKTSTCIPSSK